MFENSGGPKRVVYYHDSHDYGGMELYLFRLIKHLDSSRYTPAVLVPSYTDRYRSSPERFIQSVLAADLPLLRPPHPGDTPGYRTVKDIVTTARLLRSYGTDIVHIHTCRSEGAKKTTLAARMAGVQGVLRTEHYPPEVMKRFITPYLVKPFDWLTDFIITGSEGDRQQQIDLLKRPKNKVVCSHNSVELETFNPEHDVREVKRQLQLNPDIPVVCTVGRLAYEKGQSYLIEAMAQVVRQWGPVNLVLVGDGPLRPELEALARTLGITAHVHFVGFHDDVTPYMMAADIAAMPSLWEVFSLAMLEFMALAKPVIASNHSSFLEAFTHGQDGLVVPMKDSQKLADAILVLLNDRDLKARLGKAARARVEAHFSIHRLVAEMMDLYDGVIAKKRPSGLSPVKI